MNENERVNVTPGPRCGLEARVLVSLLAQCPAGNSSPGRGIERGRGRKFFYSPKTLFPPCYPCHLTPRSVHLTVYTRIAASALAPHPLRPSIHVACHQRLLELIKAASNTFKYNLQYQICYVKGFQKKYDSFRL